MGDGVLGDGCFPLRRSIFADKLQLALADELQCSFWVSLHRCSTGVM